MLGNMKSDSSEISTGSLLSLGLFVRAAALIMLVASLCCLGWLTAVVRFAVDGFIVNEDRNRWRGRRSDGLVGEVTVPGRAWPGVGRHSDGRRRA